MSLKQIDLNTLPSVLKAATPVLEHRGQQHPFEWKTGLTTDESVLYALEDADTFAETLQLIFEIQCLSGLTGVFWNGSNLVLPFDNTFEVYDANFNAFAILYVSYSSWNVNAPY